MGHPRRKGNREYTSKQQAEPPFQRPLVTRAPTSFRKALSSSQSHAERHRRAAVRRHTNPAGRAHFLPTASAASAAPAEPRPRRPRVSRSSQGGRGRRGGSWVGPRATAPGGAYPVWGQRENEGLETESQGESRHIVREKGRARNGSKNGGDAVPRPAVSVGGGGRPSTRCWLGLRVTPPPPRASTATQEAGLAEPPTSPLPGRCRMQILRSP